MAGSLGWARPKADLKTKTQVQVVYVGDPGLEKGARGGKEDSRGCVIQQATNVGTWGSVRGTWGENG